MQRFGKDGFVGEDARLFLNSKTFMKIHKLKKLEKEICFLWRGRAAVCAGLGGEGLETDYGVGVQRKSEG